MSHQVHLIVCPACRVGASGRDYVKVDGCVDSLCICEVPEPPRLAIALSPAAGGADEALRRLFEAIFGLHVSRET